MDFKNLQSTWNALGATDPLWAVLTEPSKRGGKWDPEEFFQGGEHEISEALDTLKALGIRLNFASALDFGSGVGRLTQALASRFDSVCGIDIAPSMVAAANQLNRHDNCRYLLNEREDLSVFPAESFDFIYTNIVLQHMEPRYSKRYLAEFMRVLKYGGSMVFEVPDQLVKPVPFDSHFYHADITLLAGPQVVTAGAVFEVSATVRNLSGQTWPGYDADTPADRIRMGNHWLRESGEVHLLDDGRTDLAADLPPQQTAELALKVHAPAVPGSYLLELDLVHEMVTWFAREGSSTVRMPVTVTPGASEPAPCEPFRDDSAGNDSHMDPAAGIEMYAIPRDEVEQIIRDHGGCLVQASPATDSGKEWIAYRYFVVKPSSRLNFVNRLFAKVKSRLSWSVKSCLKL